MAGEPDWVPPGVDTQRANVARVYDYWLGGSHNFLVDQDVGRAIAAVEPNMRAIARAEIPPFLRRVRPHGPRPSLRPAVAAGFACRRARRPQAVRVPGRRGAKALSCRLHPGAIGGEG